MFLADKDVGRPADCDAFAEKLFKFLVKLVTAKDKAVRTRCCQLVQVIFNNLTADELDADLLDDMQDILLQRLQDKIPAVRAQAVKGLPRLCDPGDVRSCAAADSSTPMYAECLIASPCNMICLAPACHTSCTGPQTSTAVQHNGQQA